MKNTTIKNKFSAFTLAEVLITLGIIGVVAALTIPTLMNNTQDAECKTAWKKAFSTINQAYNMMKIDNGGDLSDLLERPTGSYYPEPFIDEFSKYLSVQKNCLMTVSIISNVCGTTDSIDQAYKTLSGDALNQYNIAYGNLILNNGSNMFFRAYTQGKFLIWVDVNGYNKKPNTLGKDLFGAIITKDRIMPMGAKNTGLDNTCNATAVYCSSANGFQDWGSCSGAGCSAEVLSK